MRMQFLRSGASKELHSALNMRCHQRAWLAARTANTPAQADLSSLNLQIRLSLRSIGMKGERTLQPACDWSGA